MLNTFAVWLKMAKNRPIEMRIHRIRATHLLHSFQFITYSQIICIYLVCHRTLGKHTSYLLCAIFSSVAAVFIDINHDIAYVALTKKFGFAKNVRNKTKKRPSEMISAYQFIIQVMYNVTLFYQQQRNKYIHTCTQSGRRGEREMEREEAS